MRGWELRQIMIDGKPLEIAVVTFANHEEIWDRVRRAGTAEAWTDQEGLSLRPGSVGGDKK